MGNGVLSEFNIYFHRPSFNSVIFGKKSATLQLHVWINLYCLLMQMSQEIGLIPEDPGYENPFRKSSEDPDIKVPQS